MPKDFYLRIIIKEVSEPYKLSYNWITGLSIKKAVPIYTGKIEYVEKEEINVN